MKRLKGASNSFSINFVLSHYLGTTMYISVWIGYFDGQSQQLISCKCMQKVFFQVKVFHLAANLRQLSKVATHQRMIRCDANQRACQVETFLKNSIQATIFILTKQGYMQYTLPANQKTFNFDDNLEYHLKQIHPPPSHAHLIFVHFSSVIVSYHVTQNPSRLLSFNTVVNFAIISTSTNP